MNGYLTLITIPVITDLECMIRTHAQSNSNAGLSLACKAGKTQSYFSNQNGDMVTRARSRPTQGTRIDFRQCTELSKAMDV